MAVCDYRCCADDYLAQYVLDKCRELIINPRAENVEWYRGRSDVIAVEILSLPMERRRLRRLTAAIMRLFRSSIATPDILVSTIVIDPLDNRVRIHLYTDPPPPSLFRRV